MLFIVVSIAATLLTVAGLSSSLNTIMNSQRAQAAADAGALSCVIYGKNTVEQIVIENKAELISIIISPNQCQVTAQFRGVSRDAFAVARSDSHMPTLQR